MEVKSYRKKPVEIEAMQWTGENADELKLWIRGSDVSRRSWFFELDEEDREDNPNATAEIWVEANGRWLPIEIGEWVLRDSAGFYPCKPDIFQLMYEEVE